MSQIPVTWRMNGKIFDSTKACCISKFMINTEWLMVCWFSNGNRDVPDHIEIRRKCKFKNSYFSGVLEHQIVDYLQKKQIFWKRDFSLHFEPCCESKKIEIPYDVMDAKCTLIGYVVISDKPANPTLKVNDEKDLQLKFLNELSNDFALLLEPKYTSFADIYLKCGSIVIPAHKNILSVRSPFFSDMFSNKMKEIQKNEVIITDIDVPVFRIMVTYIYSGKIENLTVPLAGDLLFAADKYKLKGLKTACREYLKRNMSMENALEVLTIGDLHDPDLKAFAMEFICQNCDEFPSLERNEKWKILQKEKTGLTIEVLTSLVKSKRK